MSGERFDEDLIGPFIEGVLYATDIPRKAVSARTRIHVSTLCRLINGETPMQLKQAFSIGRAVGNEEFAKSQTNAKRA